MLANSPADAPPRSRAGRYRERAIVLGAEHPRALACIQALGRAGVPIVAADHIPNALGFSSRYVVEKFHLEESDDAALALLERLGQNGGGMLLPTNDRYLILVAKHFHALSRRFILTTPPWELLRRLMELPSLYGTARGIGIRTPDFFQPRDERALLGYVRSLDFRKFQYLLKTCPGGAPADAVTGRYTKVAGSDVGEAGENCRQIYRRTGEFPLIVRVVPGEADRGIGVSMVVNRNREIAAAYCVRRLKLFTYSRGGQFVHPYALGANVFCESAHDDEAVEAAKRLALRMEYFGPLTLEFRRDSTDEGLTLIKADPRPVRATALSDALGLNIPMALYREFTGEKADIASSYPDGIAWVWVSQYLLSLSANRNNRIIVKELFSLLKNIGRIKAVANLDRSDPMPFLVELKRWLHRFTKSVLKGARKKLSRNWGNPRGQSRAGESAP